MLLFGVEMSGKCQTDKAMRIPVRLVEGMLQEPTRYIAAGGDDDDFQDLDVPEPEDVSSDDEGAQPAAQDPAVTADGKTKKKRKKPPKVSPCNQPAVTSGIKHACDSRTAKLSLQWCAPTA